MFVGLTGVERIVARAAEVMREHKTDDVRRHGAIDLPTIQKYINFHFTVSLDLFGAEISTNAANYYTMGLKGRYDETRRADDHRLAAASYPVFELAGDELRRVEVPALTALNENLRDDYVADCAKGLARWNRAIHEAGIDYRLKLPHRAFHRGIGAFAELEVSPAGKVLSEAEWAQHAAEWLPTDEDRAYVHSLMGAAIHEPGRMANWLAPPARGINKQPLDFEYVRFN